MLREMADTRQVTGEPRRRWFYGDDCELTVWLDTGGGVIGFQLSYDKAFRQHALTWKEPDRYLHSAIDSGEDHPLRPKGSPILAADGAFDGAKIEEAFRHEAGDLPAEYFEIVVGKVREFARREGQ